MGSFGLGDLGVAAIVVLLVLREVFSFLKSRKNGDDGDAVWRASLGRTTEKMAGEIHQLYVWHDVKDSDGLPVWYVKSSLEAAIAALADNIAAQTVAYTEQTAFLRECMIELKGRKL